jgi:hypothetical protein
MNMHSSLLFWFQDNDLHDNVFLLLIYLKWLCSHISIDSFVDENLCYMKLSMIGYACVLNECCDDLFMIITCVVWLN